MKAEEKSKVEYWEACWANYEDILLPLARITFERVWPAVFCGLNGSLEKAVACFCKKAKGKNVTETTAYVAVLNARAMFSVGIPLKRIRENMLGFWYGKMLERILGSDNAELSVAQRLFDKYEEEVRNAYERGS